MNTDIVTALLFIGVLFVAWQILVQRISEERPTNPDPDRDFDVKKESLWWWKKIKDKKKK